jgi:hypothetical protein
MYTVYTRIIPGLYMNYAGLSHCYSFAIIDIGIGFGAGYLYIHSIYIKDY